MTAKILRLYLWYINISKVEGADSGNKQKSHDPCPLVHFILTPTLCSALFIFFVEFSVESLQSFAVCLMCFC